MKGLKGSNFKPLRKWLTIVIENQNHLEEMLSREVDSFKNVMTVFTCSMDSNDEELLALGIEVVASLLDFAHLLRVQGETFPSEQLEKY